MPPSRTKTEKPINAYHSILHTPVLGLRIRDQLSINLTQSRRTPLPIITLVVSEHQIIPIKVMHNALYSPVAFDLLHLGATEHTTLNSLRLRRRVTKKTHFAYLNRIGLGFEERDTETTWFEDIHYMLNDFNSIASALASWDVGFEGGVGALRLRRDVNREVMRGTACLVRSWNHTIGRESARGEEIGIDACIGISGFWVDLRETASLGDDRAESVSFCAELLWETNVIIGSEDSIVVAGCVAEYVKAFITDG